MQTAITWFEIPVADLDRAQRFYETVLDRKLERADWGQGAFAMFPKDDAATGGCLQSGQNTSARAGSGMRIYLDCMPGIDAALARVEAAGGKIISGKVELPHGIGFIASIRDTEGNEVGLHARA
ncbi:MAG: VOC family protein [Burkholderiales bacterium]